MTSDEIQDLRQLITEQFAAVHAHLTRHDEQFASMHAHLARHDEQFAAIHAHLARHDEQFAAMHAHLARHDEQFAVMGAHLARHDERLDGLGVRLTLLAREVRGELETLRERMEAGFDRVTSQMDGLAAHYERLRQEYLVMSAQLARIELSLRDHGVGEGGIERRLDLLTGEVATLRTRVDALEQQRPGD